MEYGSRTDTCHAPTTPRGLTASGLARSPIRQHASNCRNAFDIGFARDHRSCGRIHLDLDIRRAWRSKYQYHCATTFRSGTRGNEHRQSIHPTNIQSFITRYIWEFFDTSSINSDEHNYGFKQSLSHHT